MTFTTPDEPILKTDTLGRVRTPRERREALLEEFAKNGMSGTKFAEYIEWRVARGAVVRSAFAIHGKAPRRRCPRKFEVPRLRSASLGMTESILPLTSERWALDYSLPLGSFACLFSRRS